MLLKSDTSHGYFPVDDAVFASGFYLTGAGTERVGPHQPYPLPSHPDMYEFSWNSGRVLPEYQLVYIDGGEGEFESHETGRIVIRAGMAMVLMPDAWHRYRPNPQTGWEEYWLSFNGTIPHIWQQAGIITSDSPVRTIAGKGALSRRLRKLVQAAVAKPENSFAVSFFALAVLAGIFARGTQRIATPADRAGIREPPQSEDAVAHGALDIIWNYSHRNLSVGGIARKLGVTRRTLERRFLAARKHTVLQELTACRLARAQRMLRETHLPIKRIAYAAGFSSPTHLPTVFRRELHTTPRQYRAGAAAKPAGKPL